MIEVREVSKTFTLGNWPRLVRIQAVSAVSFTARNASITGLLGANGAGKTTTLRMVSSMVRPDNGEVLIDGISVQKSSRLALARLGMLTDARGLYPRLTARENVVYFAMLHGMPRSKAEQRATELAGLLDMLSIIDRRTQGFSQGERMKTALARALVHDPQNIILDEPTNGLDVVATRGLRTVLRRLRDSEGKCIVFSSHIMQEVERLCDEVVMIASGRNVAQGTVASLQASTGQTDFEKCFVQLAFANIPQRQDSSGEKRT